MVHWEYLARLKMCLASEQKNVLRSFLHIPNTAYKWAQVIHCNTGCNGGKNGGLIMRLDCKTVIFFANASVRKAVVWLIYSHLGKCRFFQHFTAKKTRLPLLPERHSCLYTVFSGLLINIQCLKRAYEKMVFIPYFLMYHREIKGSETFLIIIDFVRNRFDSPREHYIIMLLTYWGN